MFLFLPPEKEGRKGRKVSENSCQRRCRCKEKVTHLMTFNKTTIYTTFNQFFLILHHPAAGARRRRRRYLLKQVPLNNS